MTAQTFNFEYDEYNRLLLPLQYHDITCAFIDALGYRVEDLVGQSNQVRMSLISLIPPQTIVEIKQLVDLHHEYFKRWLTEENKCIFNDILHNFIKAYTTTTAKANTYGSGITWQAINAETFKLMIELIQNNK
ncbi:TPA: hypothetical protein RI779_003498 [Vibrio cholerae]|nr:hypothetical protein [Vibrio cholerae]HDV5512575.1 hypothetical protein [Vibrio cholerae]HDV5549629.1 hypothetical protein [Vibrio cholerae]